MEVVTIKVSELKKLVSQENLLPFNRKISEKHVAKMTDSIADCGILRLPVIGNLIYAKGKKAIIDGQHLVVSILKSNAKDVQCIVKDYETKAQVIADVSKLNNTQKSWKDDDFLDAWYKYGMDNYNHYQSYAYLMEKYERYDLPCGFLVGLYAKSKNEFKLGRLEFRNFDLSNEILEIADTLKTEFKMPAHSLEGLKKWIFSRENKTTNLKKLKSRLYNSLRTKEINSKISRDEFIEELSRIYTRL